MSEALRPKNNGDICKIADVQPAPEGTPGTTDHEEPIPELPLRMGVWENLRTMGLLAEVYIHDEDPLPFDSMQNPVKPLSPILFRQTIFEVTRKLADQIYNEEILPNPVAVEQASQFIAPMEDERQRYLAGDAGAAHLLADLDYLDWENSQ